jgi:hypothetical protein
MDDDRPVVMSWDEQWALADIERRLRAEEPALAAALGHAAMGHGAAVPGTPPPAGLAVVLFVACLAIGVTTFVGGQPAGLAVAAGLAALGLAAAAALTLAAHRRRARAPRR